VPPRSLLVALLALALGAPVGVHATGGVVGAYSMFGHLERYHIDVLVSSDGGERRIPLRSLARHFSRDARQMLLPAESWSLGADQVRLVERGLEDLARLVCAVHRDARSVRVRMEHGPVRAGAPSADEVRVDCGGRR
jgi:hypothetical protein